MRKRCSSDQRPPEQSFLEYPTSTLLSGLKRREQKHQCSGLQLKKAASSFYYLTRFGGNVCTAGLHSMRSNGEWPAGIVFKCDHDLLSHLCFDYGTYASEDKEISFILVSTEQQNFEIKVELYPEFLGVAGPVAVLSARWRCRRCILDTQPSYTVIRSCIFLSLDIYFQDWKTGGDETPFSNSCSHHQQARLWHPPLLSPVIFGGVVQLQLPVPLRWVVPHDFLSANKILHNLGGSHVRVFEIVLGTVVDLVLLPHAGGIMVCHLAVHLIHACRDTVKSTEYWDFIILDFTYLGRKCKITELQYT